MPLLKSAQFYIRPCAGGLWSIFQFEECTKGAISSPRLRSVYRARWPVRHRLGIPVFRCLMFFLRFVRGSSSWKLLSCWAVRYGVRFFGNYLEYTRGSTENMDLKTDLENWDLRDLRMPPAPSMGGVDNKIFILIIMIIIINLYSHEPKGS